MAQAKYRLVPNGEDAPTAQLHILSKANRSFKLYRIVSIFLVVTNLFTASLWYMNVVSHHCNWSRLVYSPSGNAVAHEKKRLFRDIEHNKYTGAPRPEHDEAWRRLIEPITIKISEEELMKIEETSIPLADGSGYLAETAVYHELHCIKRIRRHLYLDYYYPNMTEDEKLREGPHIDHCLEYLREAAMCRGDTSLATFQWVHGKPFSHVHSDHECVVWEQLDSWARGRMVNMSDYSILVPPSM